MKLIIISHPTALPDEAQLINKLMDEGLEIFHVRKPGLNMKDTIDLLLQIKPEHRSKLAMHDHHAIAEKVGTKRIHFSEEKRGYTPDHELKHWRAKQYILSTSIHTLDQYLELPAHFDYTFLGPVYDSISKSGYRASFAFHLETGPRTIEVIAIGGITPEKVKQVEAARFDGAAMLGAVWQEPGQAVKIFQNARRA
jgi:thiamine-phosphate pyrophosphorylase